MRHYRWSGHLYVAPRQSPNTVETYTCDFSCSMQVALADLWLEDLQAYADSLYDLAPATRARR